jgi:hypothetical protein
VTCRFRAQDPAREAASEDSQCRADRACGRGCTIEAAAAGVLAIAVLLVLTLGHATAHLRRIGESLVGALEQSDALVVAEALAATADRRDPAGRLVGSDTRFRLHEVLAGGAPAETFTVASPPPALRYARGQVAILALASERVADAVAWRSPQGPGSALILTAPLGAATREGLVALWNALPAGDAHGEPSAALAPALDRLLDAAPRKLALMAALDLADLGHAGRLPPSVAASLVRRLGRPALPAELRTVLQHALSEPPPPDGPSPTREAAVPPRAEPAPELRGLSVR